MPDPSPALLSKPAPKPGWRTSEFWLKVAAMALSALFASGAITSSTTLAIAGIAASMLGALGYTVSRTMIKTAVALVLLVALTQSSSACGPSSREKAIASTLAATNAAASGFLAFDGKHQSDLVASSSSASSGAAALAAWRVRQHEIERLFLAAYRAIAAAATANDDPSFSGMLAAAAQLSAALHEIGVTP